MPTKIKINVTKEVLKRSMYCGVKSPEEPDKFNRIIDDVCDNSARFGEKSLGTNCAIAMAIWDVIPYVYVGSKSITFFQRNETHEYAETLLPNEAVNFIEAFDVLIYAPERRLSLPELSFEIEVPDEVIECIPIDEIKEAVTRNPLKSVELV